MDQLDDCLLEEQEKLKNMTEEVESTFVECCLLWLHQDIGFFWR